MLPLTFAQASSTYLMPKTITQYNIFIGSPSGLDEERKAFRAELEKCSHRYGKQRDVRFHPVGWENVTGGAGRPQHLINKDLEECDYAVFLLHDRWGSVSGDRYSSGTEEEFAVAEELFEKKTIRNILLIFKDVDSGRLKDPGDQLKKVIAFKSKIQKERKYLFKTCSDVQTFADVVGDAIAEWLGEHRRDEKNDFVQEEDGKIVQESSPGSEFAFWMKQCAEVRNGEKSNSGALLFLLDKAISVATTDIEWANGMNSRAICLAEDGRLTDAMADFDSVIAKLFDATDAERTPALARAMINKGITLGDIGRSDEEIATYDDIVARFGASSDLAMSRRVATALLNKGITLGSLGHIEREIAVYDDVVARFGPSSEVEVSEQVAKAMLNKGVCLGKLGHIEGELAVYDDIVARFGTSSELALIERVAKALFAKGLALGSLERTEDEISVYDDIVARFGTSSELTLVSVVARALIGKGLTLGVLERHEDAISVYDELFARLGEDSKLTLNELDANAHYLKGLSLALLGRIEQAVVVYDEVLARFGTSNEEALKEIVTKARAARRQIKPRKRRS